MLFLVVSSIFLLGRSWVVLRLLLVFGFSFEKFELGFVVLSVLIGVLKMGLLLSMMSCRL